ncbi:D-3-phosphoglycerate dehydrogenase, chloroplastic [Hordeum vulgare]|nr:D-3-phosphoglycerate dehydrogenase, chloroplastic [Hordeum vulgare]
MPSLAPAMLHHIDPARRPRESHSVTIPSPAVDQAIFFLRSHAVTLSAACGVNATSPMAVGRALEVQLSVPVHSLRVRAHHPEHYFVIFTQPTHQVNAVRRGSIRVDGATFNITSWHEHDHASFDSLLLHVRVVIEKVPMQLWSVKGAEEILGKRVRVDRLDSRTLERGHTKTFACCVWMNDVANIPTRHTLGVVPCGAGQVEEMEGFSPSDRRVAPPPATTDYTMLIHVDRVEDWTSPSPRSSHSGQSGLPSSGSVDDDKPFPAVAPASWTMGVEDGKRVERHPRPARTPMADLGCLACHGVAVQETRTEREARGRRPALWKDVEGDSGASPGDRRALAMAWQSPLQRKSLPPPPPPARRAGSEAEARRAGFEAEDGNNGKDHVEDFFKTAKKPTIASVIVDGLAADVHAAAEAVVAAPLEFDEDPLPHAADGAGQLDAFSPTLSAAASDLGQYSRATLTTARTMEVQLGAVSGRVSQLEIGGTDDRLDTRDHFCANKQPLINTTPVRRSATPPRATPLLLRHATTLGRRPTLRRCRWCIALPYASSKN